MRQANGSSKHSPDLFMLKAPADQPHQTQNLGESQDPPKTYKNMSEIQHNTVQKALSGHREFSTKSSVHKNGGNENYLSCLQRQIDQLQTNESRQAFLRFESQAFMLRKKRNNLFRVSDKILPQTSLNSAIERPLPFDMKISGKKPGNKNAIKLQKLIKSFFLDGLTDPTDDRFLSFISNKHKYHIEENQTKKTHHFYYTESQIARVKKYFLNSNKLPLMGIQFDHDNNDDDVSEFEKKIENITDFNQEEVDCFEQRPELGKYILPKNEIFHNFIVENKKQLFKGAKLVNKLRNQKEGILKRLAYQCVREVDRRYKKCLKNQSDFTNRAKKIHREGLLYWRKRDKQLIELKKKKEKIQAEIKRKNEERQQQQTQKKKLQYLMRQSVLYSHFMAKKLGMQPQQNKQMNEGEQDNKNIEIDDQAAELNVNQMISKKMDKLQKFDGGDNLDLSKVEVQVEEADITGPPPIFQGKLKDYQVKGLKWLYNLNLQGINGILADEMGLGKTIQAIALLSHIAYTQNKWGPFLIVSPSSTLHNWQQQFQRFCPILKILPYWGNIKQRKVIRKYFSTKKFTSKHDSHFHVVITSYQMAVMDEKTFKRLKWQFIVLDEAHNIKNTMSQRWNVLKEFQSRSRLLLTGTPIQNNMAELWALLNFIMPELFDSHEQFNEWFSKDIQAHSQDQKELDKIQIQRLHAILKPFMLRRVKKDVQHEIGKKYENRILCEMTKRQKILYDSIKQKLNVKELFKMIESKSKVDNLMNLVMQLRKVCNHPELFERRPPNSPCMFQDIYYYTGFSPARNGQIKLISFSSRNPIKFYLPRLIYEDLLRKEERLQSRNKRLLNIYNYQNMTESSGLNCLNLLKISLSEVEFCMREDLLLSGILMLHWLKRNPSTLAMKNPCIHISDPKKTMKQRFSFKKRMNSVDMLQKIYIPSSSAPTIYPIISSSSFYNLSEEILNNKYQRYILQGKYKQKWGHMIPDPQFQGIIPKNQYLTKIELVNFGSLIADSAKLKQLDKILREKRDNGDKVLIFCQMTKMLDILQDFMNLRKYPFFRLDGGCSLSDRRDMVNEFQKQNSRVFAFLLSTRAGGLGVTLTAANNVIFYDNDWNPTMDAQATDRAHRIGQTRDVFVYQLVTMGTIEDRIVKRAEQKKTVQSTVYEGAALNIFKKDMIMELMADELGVQQQEEAKKEEPGQKKRGPKATKPTIGVTKEKITA